MSEQSVSNEWHNVSTKYATLKDIICSCIHYKEIPFKGGGWLGVDEAGVAEMGRKWYK